MSSPALLPLCLLLLGLAAPVRAEEAPTPAPEPPAAPTALAPALTRSQEQQQALMRQLPAEQQKTLQAGDESFLALLVPAARAKASGTVVLVPGDGESADWPNVIAPVRQELPTYGWQTISLSLPDPYDPVVAIERDTAPADTDAQANSEQTAPPVTGGSGTAPAAPTQAEAGSGEPAQAAVAPVDPEAAANAQAARVLARIAAGIDLALQQSANPIVLVGHGTGAYWAARYLAEKEPAEVRQLVLIDGREPQGLPPRLDATMGKTDLQIADLVHAPGPAAQRRKERAAQKANKGYRQIDLPVIPGDRSAEQEQTVRRLRAWLDRLPPAASGSPAAS
ncbi:MULTISPECIES: alpha/beta hydrolase family protein [Pseudomonas]|uniref:alpha/beta hydrolase family protein n=1 Tax=Pseudomonas TaxID=286 RepID=UPI0021DA9572|nr:alpha/beta hydrolase family protein [Pseudomonas oryzihabitans]